MAKSMDVKRIYRPYIRQAKLLTMKNQFSIDYVPEATKDNIEVLVTNKAITWLQNNYAEPCLSKKHGLE